VEGLGEGCEGIDGVVGGCDAVYNMLAVDILEYVDDFELVFELVFELGDSRRVIKQ
jgi:hypothetical protein